MARLDAIIRRSAFTSAGVFAVSAIACGLTVGRSAMHAVDGDSVFQLTGLPCDYGQTILLGGIAFASLAVGLFLRLWQSAMTD